MQVNFGSNVETLAQLKSTVGNMDKEQKEQFKSLSKEANLISKEDFSRDMADFLNTVEAKQILIIWMKIREVFEIDHENQNSEVGFNMETKLGKLTLENKEFIEFRFSTLDMARKLLGNDISFPQQTAPKIFKEMAEDHNADLEEKNEFHLHALVGQAKIKVLEDKCIIFLSTQVISRDFLARMYLNLRINEENSE